MTNPISAASDLDSILARTRHLFLDFDGPICSIFAGLPSAAVAERLRNVFGDHAQLPGGIASTVDPFAVFAYAATISEDLAARVESEMTDLELAAVATATPTPYVHEVVTACQNSGRSVAVVSNNSARAVRSYLGRHGLDDRISLVVARTDHDPDFLKPSPHLITRAVDTLDAEPGECTLVGDSVTDIQAARLASIQSIGYANEADKRERLTTAEAGAIINSLADLALRLRARVANPELLQLSPRLEGGPPSRSRRCYGTLAFALVSAPATAAPTSVGWREKQMSLGPTALKFSGLWGLVSGFPGLVTVWLQVGRGGVTGCVVPENKTKLLVGTGLSRPLPSTWSFVACQVRHGHRACVHSGRGAPG